ncbi:MAG TPA: hypothetical protein VM617_00720 [Thermoanaerobaculia bacterium]|nr:hypothetical protein [Thermoanaerobaculia bacterium]
MLGFLRYAALRSLYPLLALAGIWGSLLWGPWLSFPLALALLHLTTWFERWSGHQRHRRQEDDRRLRAARRPRPGLLSTVGLSARSG